jgi:hypothetical protein
VQIGLTNLPDGSGRVSLPRDLGASPRASLFRWKARTVFQSLPVQGQTVDYYWSGYDFLTSSGTPLWPDGSFGSGDFIIDGTLPTWNLQYIGGVSAQVAASGTTFVSGGVVQLFCRYGALVVCNHGGAALSANAGDHEFILTGTPDEIE